jgi:hypothetical protein
MKKLLLIFTMIIIAFGCAACEDYDDITYYNAIGEGYAFACDSVDVSQMFYEKFVSKAHCKNYVMRLHNNLTSNHSNPILDYLSIIETGAKSGDDDGG